MVDGSFIEELVAEQVRRNDEVIETMCEQMLVQTGNRGVLITPLASGAVAAELSDHVPFGEIHYAHTEAGRW